MKVCIIGAGAIGMLFGGYLHQGGHKLLFITRTKAQAEQLQTEGCTVQLSMDQEIYFKPECLAMEEQVERDVLGGVDLLIITVKQPNLMKVAKWLKEYSRPKLPIVCLMNGLGHQEILGKLLPNPLYYSITASGATRLSNLRVCEKGRGETKIGQTPNRPSLDSLAAKVIRSFISTLQELEIPISYSNDIEMDMWKKCVINACINPLTALFQVRNGLLIENNNLRYLMRQIYIELPPLIEKVHGKNAQKILNNGRLWEEIEEVCRITSENTSSMLQDILYNQTTEIEAVTGYLLSIAEKYHLTLPNHLFVYQALQFLQNRGEE